MRTLFFWPLPLMGALPAMAAAAPADAGDRGDPRILVAVFMFVAFLVLFAFVASKVAPKRSDHDDDHVVPLPLRIDRD